MTTPTSKPFGRSLSDFGELLPAERLLRKAVRLGEAALISKECPKERTPQNEIRAHFLRFLALGGDEQTPVHERGVLVAGAWISGRLDVMACDIPGNFGVSNSHFDSAPNLQDAHFHGFLNLQGSKLPGLSADRMIADGGLFLREGFSSTGEVRLLGAYIRGGLTCNKGRFNNPAGNALSADNANIGGSIFLNDGFQAQGAVRLLGAHIGGDLVCRNGSFNNPAGNTLSADKANIRGSIFLDDGFQAQGAVRLAGVQIVGDLYCDGGSFSNEKGNAFVAEKMSVTGSLFFRSLNEPVTGINLSDAEVGALIDDEQSWGSELVLDGFVYHRLGGAAPYDATTRIAWLKKQRQVDCNTPDSFKTQPWKQLIRTLHKASHNEAAKQVMIAFETLRRKNKVISNPVNRLFHFLYGQILSYGYYQPRRLFFSMVAIWLFCAGSYWIAALHDVFAPSNPLIFNHGEYAACRPGYLPGPMPPDKGHAYGNWYLCPQLAGEYTGFSPLAYSLDLILPLVDLQQEHDWAPYIPTPESNWWDELTSGSKYHWTRLLVWLEILFGWLASSVLVGEVSGLANRKFDD